MCASWDGNERRTKAVSIGRARDRRQTCHPYEKGHTCAYCEAKKQGRIRSLLGRA